MTKCPYCYRPLETWLKNPILLPNGAEYNWSDSGETTLIEVPNVENRIYKGTYQISEPEVKEIQNILITLEEENLAEIDRTIFSPLNTSGKFQIAGVHIKEMRDSVEKLLDATGLDKVDYFNYDEDGNHITHPNGDKLEWTDPITEATDLKKFQVKAIHIEDLRHFIQLMFFEQWDKDYQTIQIYDYGRIEPNSLMFITDISLPIPIYLTSDTMDKYWEGTVGSHPDILPSRKGQGYSKIEIISGKKIKLTQSGKNDVNFGPGVFSFIDNLTTHLSPYKIAEPIYLFPVTININNNTCVGTDIVFTIPAGWGQVGKPWGNPLRITVAFSNNNFLEYYFLPGGEIPFSGKSVRQYTIDSNGLTSFTRNLYDDYILSYGSSPIGLSIHVSYFSNLFFGINVSDNIIYTQSIELDNIFVKTVSSPIITPAIQGTNP